MMSSLPHDYIIDDDNRVVLQPLEDHVHDFVNASYVDVSTAMKTYQPKHSACYSLTGI